MPINFTLSYDKIEFRGGFIAVRGLSASDIANLVYAYKDVAAEIYAKVTDKNMAAETVEGLVGDVLGKFPTAMAYVIAVAADSPDELDVIGKLPLDVQAAAIEKIVTLTFETGGGVGNFMEMVLRLAGSARTVTGKLNSPAT